VGESISYGFYTDYEHLWNLVEIGGELNDYWAEGTTSGTAWYFWGTRYWHGDYWGAGDGASYSLVSVTGTGAWSLIARPS